MIYYLLFFILGSIVGSFLNVVICRADSEKSAFSGRSSCFFCQKILCWWELIPILNFFILRGRCLSCKKRISWQYPLVEFITASLFTLTFWRFQRFPYFSFLIDQWPSWESLFFLLTFIFWLYWLAVLIVISVYDFQKYLILNSVLIPAVFISGVWFIIFYFVSFLADFRFLKNYLDFFQQTEYLYYLTGTVSFWLSPILGAFIASSIIGLIALISKGKAMGWGDPLLALFLGLILGWPAVLAFLIITFLLSGLVALILIVLRKKTLKSFVPFAPLLSLGAVLIFLFGDIIIKGYLSLFNNFLF